MIHGILNLSESLQTIYVYQQTKGANVPCLK